MAFMPSATAASDVRRSSGVVPVGEALDVSPVESDVVELSLPHATRVTKAAAATSPASTLEFRITLLESVSS